MLKDRNSESTDTITIDITYEVYLKGRDEPILTLATFELAREIFTEGQEVQDVVRCAENHIRATIDVVSEHRWFVSDGSFNKSIFLTDQIQAISIHAPSRETVMKALEG